MPLIRRIPKRGFSHRRFATDWAILNVGALEHCPTGAPITPDVLRKVGFVHGAGRPVKLLGDGEVTKPLQVHAHAFSASARQKIESAGGTVTVLPR